MSEQNSVTVFCLTGGPCAGKSTGLSSIADDLTSKGYKVFTIPETATELISGGMTPSNSYEFQSRMFDMQLAKENIYKQAAEEYAENNNQNVAILCDRGLPDNGAYTDSRTFEKILDDHNMTRSDMMNRYDAVVHLQTAAIGTNLYSTENNAARTETAEEAVKLDENIRKSYVGHPHLRVVDNSTDFAHKIDRVKNEIHGVLGIPEPLEIEKKFLIEKPSPEVLDNLEFCSKTHITQTYLNAYDNDTERRVRKRGNEKDGYAYFYTEKTSIGDGERIERESKISEEQYNAYLADKDNSKNVIEKDRYCFLHDNQYFELDTYPFDDKKAAMEIELNTINDKVNIPPFIKVIKDVTNMPGYSNNELADTLSFPEEDKSRLEYCDTYYIDYIDMMLPGHDGDEDVTVRMDVSSFDNTPQPVPLPHVYVLGKDREHINDRAKYYDEYVRTFLEEIKSSTEPFVSSDAKDFADRSLTAMDYIKNTLAEGKMDFEYNGINIKAQRGYDTDYYFRVDHDALPYGKSHLSDLAMDVINIDEISRSQQMEREELEAQMENEALNKLVDPMDDMRRRMQAEDERINKEIEEERRQADTQAAPPPPPPPPPTDPSKNTINFKTDNEYSDKIDRGFNNKTMFVVNNIKNVYQMSPDDENWVHNAMQSFADENKYCTESAKKFDQLTQENINNTLGYPKDQVTGVTAPIDVAAVNKMAMQDQAIAAGMRMRILGNYVNGNIAEANRAAEVYGHILCDATVSRYEMQFADQYKMSYDENAKVHLREAETKFNSAYNFYLERSSDYQENFAKVYGSAVPTADNFAEYMDVRQLRDEYNTLSDSEYGKQRARECQTQLTQMGKNSYEQGGYAAERDTLKDISIDSETIAMYEDMQRYEIDTPHDDMGFSMPEERAEEHTFTSIELIEAYAGDDPDDYSEDIRTYSLGDNDVRKDATYAHKQAGADGITQISYQKMFDEVKAFCENAETDANKHVYAVNGDKERVSIDDYDGFVSDLKQQCQQHQPDAAKSAKVDKIEVGHAISSGKAGSETETIYSNNISNDKGYSPYDD